jgi:NADP-dependent 3-hydroxy acid dehydrogenase YdfG
MAHISDLTGRTALVTGASRGIGFAVAQQLSRGGVRVAMVARGEAELGEAAEQVGGFALAADVSQRQAVERLTRSFTSVLDAPAPDYLVNAAGAFSLAPLSSTSPDDFDRSLAVNLRGPFLLIRAFLPAMLERGTGHIVTTGSIAGRHAFPSNGAYSASKFGVRGLHAVLDQELKGTGVRSTLVEPAATDTTLWDAVDRDSNPGLPEGSAMLDADAVADAVLFAITRPDRTGIHVISLERA